jgi:hypothetical protein
MDSLVMQKYFCCRVTKNESPDIICAGGVKPHEQFTKSGIIPFLASE